MHQSDNPPSVQTAAVSTLPAAVQQTFVDAVRSGTDAQGELTVEYVPSTRRVAEPFVTFGDQTLVDLDKPVYVLFVKGSYTFKWSGSCPPPVAAPPDARPGSVIESPPVTGACGPLPGGIVAIIGTDGANVMTTGYGNTIPDLSKLGTPSTTAVDVGT